MRIVPIDPPPPVKFEEFDGLTRIIFSRRNKTVHASFTAKGVLSLLEANWKTWCSVNEQVCVALILVHHPLYSGVLAQIIDDGLSFKDRVDTILTESGFSEERAAKMSINSLLE